LAERPQTWEADAASAPTAQLPADPHLKDFLHLAALNNPGLAARYENWRAQLSLVAKAGGWPDPVLSYGYYLQSVETAVGPQEQRLALTQAIPWFGKLSARKNAAAQRAKEAQAMLRAAQLELFARVAQAYYEYAYLASATAVTEENLELMRYQESVMRSRYQTDSASYANVIKAQVELGVLEDHLLTLNDRRKPLASRLNQTLGRAADAQLPWPVPLKQPIFSFPAVDELRRELLANSPQLNAIDHRLDAISTSISAAKRDGYPDFTVGVQTILTGTSELTSFPGQGKDAWIATLAVKLPLWRGKYSGEVNAQRARQRQTEHERKDRELTLLAQVDETLFQLHDAERKIDLYGKSLVPKAKQALEASTTGFQTGKLSYLDYIDAQRTLLQFELEHARAEADRGERVVQLAALIGTSLDESGPATASESQPNGGK
jgi:outer membrane protein TolC